MRFKPGRKILLFLLLASFMTYANAEQNMTTNVNELVNQQNDLTVKGKVVDAKNIPLIGVNVFEKGNEVNGTITDPNGNYNLTLKNSDATIVFSYIGFVKLEMLVNGKGVIDVILQEETENLDEVVVTALGIRRSEKALAYNVQEVKSEELLTNKDANFVNALNGKVAGVTINSSSSGVGGVSKVVMRGTKAIAQSNNALYVIDGVPMFNFGAEKTPEPGSFVSNSNTGFGSSGNTEAIADLNPEDIESISVLTGAAAAALYGSNASNGAIVITTKKGKAGKTSLTINSGTEIVKTFILPEFQNRYGTGDLTSEVDILDKSWGHKLNDANYMGYSPKSDFFNTGLVQTNGFSFSTGTEKNQTYLSGSNVDSEGVISNNEYKRYTITFRNTTSFLDDKVKLDVGGTLVKQEDCNMINQGTYNNPLVSAYLFPRGDDWEDVKMYERFNPQRQISEQYWPQGLDEYTGQNPYWIANRTLRTNDKDRYMLNAGLSYDFKEWLNFSGRIRVDNSVNDNETKYYAGTSRTLTEGSQNGFYGTRTRETEQTYADFLININKRWQDLYTMQANIGTSYSDMQQYELMNEGPIRGDGIPNLFNVFQLDDSKTKREQSGWHDQTQSVFGSVEFGFKSSYYLTLTARNDWTSQLAGPRSNVSSFFYPSIGTSFVLSEIFNLPQQVNYAKLRASYASVGLPFARFLANPTYRWDNANKVWQTKTHYPMYDLKPERTNSLEIGLTAKILKKFNLDVSYYETKTFNQTFDPKISVSSGYSTLYVQTGNIKNSGFELALGYENKWNAFGWSTNYTLSSNKNEILELVDNYKHPETGALITKDKLDLGGYANARFIAKKGGSLGDLYSIADLKRDGNGYIYVDTNGKMSPQYNINEIELGSVFPKANMSWRNNLSYKNLNLGFMVSARLGGIVYSGTQAAMDFYGVSERSAIARDNGGVIINGNDLVSAQEWFTTIGAKSGIPQYYTYSATNVRLQEASLAYTINKKHLKNVADVTLSLVGKNLLMIYKKAPFDPESVATAGNYYQGIDYFMMPSLSSYGFNVRVKF